MTFAWPWMLPGLLLAPAAVLWYRRLVRARERRRAELAALGLVGPPPGRRRHLPPLLMLGALVLLLTAAARPEAVVPQPRRVGTVILVFDVSSSMAATDVAPSRLAAAQAAARGFVERQPATVRLGVVAFSGSGVLAQEPTTDRGPVLAAIDRLAPQGGTALSGGLQTALGAIVGRPVLIADQGGGVEATGPDLGFHASAAIVLLTDGENTGAPDPLEVAEVVSTAGVRVYPIGLGSPQGTVVEVDGFQVATALDEPLLREIAARTDGAYFGGPDEQALAAVYDAIELTWTVEDERIEVTALLAAAAGVLLLAAVGLALAWTGRAV